MLYIKIENYNYFAKSNKPRYVMASDFENLVEFYNEYKRLKANEFDYGDAWMTVKIGRIYGVPTPYLEKPQRRHSRTKEQWETLRYQNTLAEERTWLVFEDEVDAFEDDFVEEYETPLPRFPMHFSIKDFYGMSRACEFSKYEDASINFECEVNPYDLFWDNMLSKFEDTLLWEDFATPYNISEFIKTLYHNYNTSMEDLVTMIGDCYFWSEKDREALRAYELHMFHDIEYFDSEEEYYFCKNR